MPKFFWFSYIFWQFLLKILFFLMFNCSLNVISFLVDFPVMRWLDLSWLDLSFLNSLSLMLKFFAISPSNHSFLAFLILAVFKGAILLTTSINFWKKIVVCLVYIMIFCIVWECNFGQSIFVLIYWILKMIESSSKRDTRERWYITNWF